MEPRKIESVVQRHLVRVRTIAFAFCASAVAYVLAGWLLIEVLGFEPLLDIPLSVAVAVAALQLPLIVVGYLISRRIRAPRSSTPRDGGAANEIEAALQRYTQSVVVASAIRELAAVIGLLLTLFTGDVTWVVLLSVAAVGSMLLHWPRRGAIEDYLQQLRMSR